MESLGLFQFRIIVIIFFITARLYYIIEDKDMRNAILHSVSRRLFSKENKSLFLELVRTDFKLRYQGSFIGYAWSLLKPLLLFVILYIVFVYFLKVGRDIEHYPVYLLLGIVMWNFFTEMTVQSLGSIVGRGDLIRKIKIPRWMIVLATSASASINLFFSLLVVFIFMAVNGVPVTLAGVGMLLLYVAITYVFALGISFLLSALYVRFRDVSYIWEIVLQAGFYATPIIYPLQMVKNVFIEKILILNPLALVIQGARHDLINSEQTLSFTTLWGSRPVMIVVSLSIIVIFIVVGIAYFKKQSRYFAENI